LISVGLAEVTACNAVCLNMVKYPLLVVHG
jgi:hypothetical protein